MLGYETDAGLVREYKSAAERMSKAQREKAGYKRITAYCLAEGLKMKLLAGFLKREHNVQPRVFDEAMYVVSVTRDFGEILHLTTWKDVPFAALAGVLPIHDRSFLHCVHEGASDSPLRGRREWLPRVVLRYPSPTVA